MVVAPEVLAHGFKVGVHTLTLWLFSTENWRREAQELAHLMRIYTQMCDRLRPILATHRARLHVVGRLDRVPHTLASAIGTLVEDTAHHTDHALVLALDYGGGDELVRAIQRAHELGLDPATLTEAHLAAVMDTAPLAHPDPDLVVRTSGEVRISGFMPWQSRYAELVFVAPGFPDFSAAAFDSAVAVYRRRVRRFGR